MMQNSFRCVLLIADGLSVQLIFLNGYVNGVSGQGSRSARTSIALLCLLCVQVPKTPFQASSNNIGIVRWCGKG